MGLTVIQLRFASSKRFLGGANLTRLQVTVMFDIGDTREKEGSPGFGPFEDHAFYPRLESPSVTATKASEAFQHSGHSSSGLGGSPF